MPKGQLGVSCIDAVEALDEDGDGYLPGADPEDEGVDALARPDACDDDAWATIASKLEDDGYGFDDCDDTRMDVHPDATEDCDQTEDLNCDGELPEKTTRYTDGDGDGYGDPSSAQELCGAPQGTVDNGDDCDDLDPQRSPGAVETVCGPTATDLNCDENTDCAVAGAVDSHAFGDLGVTEDLGYGAGRALDAGEDGRVLVGGENGAWILTGDGREIDSEELTIDGSVGAGADVCWLDVDDMGSTEPIVGDPAHTSGVGQFSILYPDGNPGALSGSGANQRLGATFDGADGLLVAAKFLEGSWRGYLLPSALLPESGDSLILTVDSIEFADVSTLNISGSREFAPAFSVASTREGWLVAIGQPDDDTESRRVQLYTLIDGDLEGTCALIDTDRATTLGTAVLLADITGDDAPDLIVGEPGAQSIYIFADADCGSDATVADADYTLTSSTTAEFGATLAALPDMNGDGIDDLIVGGSDGVELVLGGASGPGTYATLTGTGLGAAVAGADLDGDGYGDLILGDGAGSVTVLWGGPRS